MANILDFTKIKKAHFTVVLDDGENTRLLIPTPSKKLSEQIDYVFTQEFIGAPLEEQYEMLYEVTTAILNNNTNNVELKLAAVEECLNDIVDVWTLINAYRAFIAEQLAARQKN